MPFEQRIVRTVAWPLLWCRTDRAINGAMQNQSHPTDRRFGEGCPKRCPNPNMVCIMGSINHGTRNLLASKISSWHTIQKCVYYCMGMVKEDALFLKMSISRRRWLPGSLASWSDSSGGKECSSTDAAATGTGASLVAGKWRWDVLQLAIEKWGTWSTMEFFGLEINRCKRLAGLAGLAWATTVPWKLVAETPTMSFLERFCSSNSQVLRL